MGFIIKKINLKIGLGAVIIAGLAAGFLSGILARAAGPEFNKYPITYSEPGAPGFLDYPLLDARRVGGSYSASQADHDNGVTAGPGEEIEFSIYYHNGVADDAANTAVSTIVKAFASPGLGTEALEHTISATIDASNSSAVSSSDAARGGDMRVNISGGVPRSLALVSGSVLHLKNWGSRDPQNGSTDVSQTVGQSNNIFSSGVNIGDVRGCWPFFGFVKFRMRVSTDAVEQGLEITKRVLNVSESESEYKDSTNAAGNDLVRFQIEIKTTGNAAQTSVTVRDTLPSRLKFESGENLIETLNLGTLQSNQTRTFTFDARVTAGSAATVTNTARVQSSVVSEKSDSATVVITKDPDEARNLEIEKRVRNESRNETSYRESTSAAEGDIVNFEILIRTTGNVGQTGVVVRDTLSSHLDFVAGDDLSGSGRNLGTLLAGQSRTLNFEARVTGSTSGTITNTARVRSNEVSEKSDSASITISSNLLTQGSSRGLTIIKRVKNLSDNTSFSSSVSADPGKIVQFEILVETSGNASQRNVTVRDSMPAKLTWRSGEQLSGSGRNLGTLAAGTTRVLSYEATVADNSQFSSGTQVLTNTATVASDEVFERRATAQVSVTKAEVTASAKRKTAFNITRQINATQIPALPGDVIAYAIYFRNTGSQAIAGKVIEDNIADILELAEIADQGGAVSVDSVIRWAPVDVPAGTEVSRTFQVRVRSANLFPPVSDLEMVNIFGNEVRVRVARPVVAGITAVPPRTGASANLTFFLAGLFTLGYWSYRRKFRPVYKST